MTYSRKHNRRLLTFSLYLLGMLLLFLSRTLSCSSDDSVEPEPNTIFGHVTEAGTEHRLTKVNISLDGINTQTNSSGSYSIQGLDKGTYLITATLSSYQDYSAEVKIDGRSLHNFEMELSSQVE